MGQCNGCGSTRNDVIFNSHLGSGAGLISQTYLLVGHQISNNVENTNQRGVRLFYCKSELELLDLEEIIALREEIKLFIKSVNNSEKKNYFLERARDLEKIFPDEKNFWNTTNKKKLPKF